MIFPLDFMEFGLLLAVIALVLITTSELILSSHRRNAYILLNKKKLRNTAILFSILFIAIVILRAIDLMLESALL